MSKPDALDYSYGRPDPAQLAAAGIRLVSRYLSHDTGKNLTAAEARALHAAGIGILLNWESVEGRPLGGAATGGMDGRDAAALCEQIGAPHGLTIYYSCDTDTTPGQWPIIADYYAAAGKATAGRYQVGVYGEADLIDYLHRQGVVTSEWQTVAWSNGRLSANADLFQYLINQTMAGAAVDFDRIINPDQLGAWWPEGSEFNMPTAQEIAAAVWREPLTDSDGKKQPASAWLKQSRNLSDPDVLAQKLAGKLQGVTADQIKAALKAVFAEAGK